MDLKPSNVVLSATRNAKIIDISGLATTWEWMPPEFKAHIDPTSLPWDSRVRGDIWALGRLLSLMIRLELNERKASFLAEIIRDTTDEHPKNRSELNNIVLKLVQYTAVP